MLTSVAYLALSALSYVSAGALPAQIHIALAGTDDQGNSNTMAVSWQTETDTPTSKVQYGVKPGEYIYSSDGSSSACGVSFIF
jgi:hypothetical protein